MKRLATVALLCSAVALAGCSKDEEKPDPTKPTTFEVKAGGVETKTMENGENYLELTNASGENVTTLWFKLNTDVDKGVVDINRCSEEWNASGDCEGQISSVLPNVDLAGWEFELAAGGLALNDKESAFLKFDVKDVKDKVSFTVSVEEPKDQQSSE